MSDRDNIIKRVCKELGLTYKELGEKIGYSESAINNAAATGKISNQLNKAINLYLENIKLKKDLNKLQQLQSILRDLISK